MRHPNNRGRAARIRFNPRPTPSARFGDRARGKALTVVKAAEPVFDAWQDVLLDLALHIGINKVVKSIR